MTLEQLQQIVDDIEQGEKQTALRRIIFTHADRRAYLIRVKRPMDHTIYYDAARWVPPGFVALVYTDRTVYLASVSGLGYAKLEHMVYVGTL